MIKILLGGSPCTFWSIAQKNNRETEASGQGWELFKNYLIAKEKFQPDFFLYENNKSAAQPIKDQISHELGVDLMHINSALVSAQNRQRFYAFNWDVDMPTDRGIVLTDILETGCVDRDRAHCLKHQQGNARDYFKKHHTQIAFEAVGVGYRNRREEDGKLYRRFETHGEEKANALTTVQTDSMVATPIALNMTTDEKAQCVRSTCYKDGIRNLIGNNVDRRTCVATPVRVGLYPNADGECKAGQGNRIYSDLGKSVTIQSSSGGKGGKTGLYAITTTECDAKNIYEVRNGLITIKGREYPIKLPDGTYQIRKLTPVECERLQTMLDDYTKFGFDVTTNMVVPISDTQRYKCLGNGWTAEVIIHILHGALKDIPKDEEIVVLSMYDGIATGRYCLEQLGFNNITYYAYEIDKYAKSIAQYNYPDIIQLGDAFQVRDDDWMLPVRDNVDILEKAHSIGDDAILEVPIHISNHSISVEA